MPVAIQPKVPAAIVDHAHLNSDTVAVDGSHFFDHTVVAWRDLTGRFVMSGSNAANNSGGQQPAGENGQEDLPLTSTAQNERSAARSYSFTVRVASGNVVNAHRT